MLVHQILRPSLTHKLSKLFFQTRNYSVPKKAEPLHPDLIQQLKKLREKKAFDAEKWIDLKTDKLNSYMRDNGLKACVVSVSGGIDSAVTFGLLKKAQGKSNSPIKRVVGIAQPIKSSKETQERTYELKNAFGGTEIITVDQSEQHTKLQALCDQAIGITGGEFSAGQLKSYMRTPVNYYIAQLLSQSGLPCIVLGTGNMDEDGYLYYFCKAGDGIADVQLIGDLHKSEVKAVGSALSVPATILNAKPSADLWAGQTDEDELGFSYDFVELYTSVKDSKLKKLFKEISPEARDQYERLGKAAVSVHLRNNHKEEYPINL
jgi:NAD+ synthase (glutamine-hydrolysing)